MRKSPARCGRLGRSVLLPAVLVSSACQLYKMSWLIQNLSSLFLNELSDGASTTSDGKLFYILTILQLKVFPQVIMRSAVCEFKRLGSSGMH